MAQYTLVIGNKAYSSWSMRPWLLMRQAGIVFDEVRIPLYQDGHDAKIRAWSPAGRVPVLRSGELTVWDSLAICETLAERHPEKNLWPADAAARAHARAVSAEMHAGFAALRSQMGMNVRRTFPDTGRTPEVARDIARIEQLWSDCLQRHGGPFLFGAFSVADAMYAPVATRFRTYAVGLSGAAQRYATMLLDLPAVREWYADAATETEVLPQFEQQAAP
ncbi:MAG: glutathione S-transferase family protein [Betaproteobacteria bacterium]|nr:glutathione S-transferase family protein [Betaproteobacteria bacterium]